MTEQDAIKLLKGMQNPLEDYADMVCAPAWAHGHRYVYQEPEDYAIDMAIEALKEKESQKWIPVGEQLPADEEMVLVTCQTKKGALSVNRAYCSGGFWHGSGSMSGVIAWMPLPEPFNPQD